MKCFQNQFNFQIYLKIFANNMPGPIMAFYQGRGPADPQQNGALSNFAQGNCYGSKGIKFKAADNILARQ
jgi:hypothetical protein